MLLLRTFGDSAFSDDLSVDELSVGDLEKMNDKAKS